VPLEKKWFDDQRAGLQNFSLALLGHSKKEWICDWECFLCPAAKRLGKKPRPPKVNLFRQSSLPADWLADLKDSIDETGPSPQIPGMTSPDESLSGGTSEETGADHASGKASMYSRDDSFFLNDTSSGGLWNSLPNSGTEFDCFIFFHIVVWLYNFTIPLQQQCHR
jgi:hypothetical protein